MLTRQQLIEFLHGKPRRIHLVGIGGCGMSGIARLLVQQGHHVSGCDAILSNDAKELARQGVEICEGHSADHLCSDTELIVHTSAVKADNEELRSAQEWKIPSVRRGTILTALMSHKNNIAVTGTHGKTTTTAMIALVLSHSKSAPSFCIGAHVPILGTNAQIGGGNYFVAEADESDGTLVGFTPQYAVCLNIEPEHLDHYGSMDQLLSTVDSFLSSALKAVFYCADCTSCVQLSRNLKMAISFGLSEKADYRAIDITPTNRGSRFTVACRDQVIGTAEIGIPGKQNVVNALAAIAVGDELGLPFDSVAGALAEFSGANRRFERKFEDRNIVVVDDYAHHPTEIAATISAARTLGFERILVAFQPHRYSRTQALFEEISHAFGDADKLWVTDVYAANEEPIEGVNGKSLLEAVQVAGHKSAKYEPNFDRLQKALASEVKPGDLVLTLGAGDIHQVSTGLSLQLKSTVSTQKIKQHTDTKAELQKLLSRPGTVAHAEPLARHTTLRVGGPAEYWVEPSNEQDLTRVLQYCNASELAVTIIGRGSNLLVRDGGISGVVIHLGGKAFVGIELNDDQLIVAAGTPLRTIVNFAKKNEIGGLEFLEGIPGSLGGALRMNAGAMGHQTFEVVKSVRYVSFAGQIYTTAGADLPVTYRSCPTLVNHIVLSAILQGEKMERVEISRRLREYEEKRWNTQPAKPSAGCIFKNPTEISAGKLIDELGLKGTIVGKARVSDVHGNFIVTERGATAGDVLGLIDIIRKRARGERGIDLEPEVMIVGNEAP